MLENQLPLLVLGVVSLSPKEGAGHLHGRHQGLGRFVVDTDNLVLPGGGELRPFLVVIQRVHLVVLVREGMQALARRHVPVLHHAGRVGRQKHVFRPGVGAVRGAEPQRRRGQRHVRPTLQVERHAAVRRAEHPNRPVPAPGCQVIPFRTEPDHKHFRRVV